MDYACSNCGNRQHAPDATVCRVCGRQLSDAYPGSGHSLGAERIPALGTGHRQNLPLALRPCLTDQTGRQYIIHPDRETLIGSLPGVDITIPGFKLQPRHARLFPADQQIVLEAMIGCLVLINGRAVGRATRILLDRDLIMFGPDQVLVYTANGPIQPSQISRDVVRSDLDVLPEAAVVREVLQSRPNCDLYGRIRHVDGPYMEDPDPNLGRALARAAGFALALWKPAFVMLRRPDQQVPVRYLRVETLDGEVRMVKMKGHLVSGAFHTGDLVAIWGEWQNGTLLMHRGLNQTTRAEVYLRQ